MPTISAEALKTFAIRAFEAVGVQASVAERTASHLVESNLAGVDSHGVMRLPGYLEWVTSGKVIRAEQIEIVQDHGPTVLLDGHSTLGPVVAARGADIAIDKAREFGIGLVTARNSAHIGRLGEYVEHIAREGLIGFLCCNSQGAGQIVAPWGGREGRLSTNPMAWGIPTRGDPIVLDVATSVAAEGKIRVKFRRGEQVPPGWIIDAQGNRTTNPAALYGPPLGAILTAGQHKGYGLSIVVEALAGILSGGGFVRAGDAPDGFHNAFTILAIDVGRFGGAEQFAADADQLVAHLKSAASSTPSGEVLVPNEPEIRERRRRLNDGIPIEDETWRQLEAIGHRLNIPL